MNYIYITLNRSASIYAISLDEIFMTLYGFGKRKRFKSYSPALKTAMNEVPGIVYSVEVTPEQHDKVRDILCDFLVDSNKHRMRFRRQTDNFSSSEFVGYILDQAGVIRSNENVNDIAELDQVKVIYEGDLRDYVPKTDEAEHGCVEETLLNRIKKDKKVMERGTAQYEYVPDQM